MSNEVILRAIDGSLKGEEFIFEEKGLCLVGRSNDCALQIPKENDMRISRRHCLIILDPPHVRLRDLNSRNGTFVNDVRIQPGSIGDEPDKVTPVDVVLKDGDIISIGETILQLEIPSQKNVEKPKPAPPLGTKVIKLAKPSKTHTGTLIPKSQPVDTGFFRPSISLSTSKPTDASAPMTEVFPKPKPGAPVAGTPTSEFTSTKPEQNQKPVIPLRGNQSAPVSSQVPPAPAPAVPVSTLPAQPPKNPIILNSRPHAGSDSPTVPPPDGAKPLLKAKIVGKKHENPDLTEVMDVSELADDIALSADYIRKEKSKKRVTKFKIKGPK